MFLGEAVILYVSIFLAVEAEGPFLGGPLVAGVFLTLLVAGGIRVELPEHLFLVHPLLFVAGDSFDSKLFLIPGRGLFLGGLDREFGTGVEVASSVGHKFVCDFLGGRVYKSEIVEFVPDFFLQSGDEGADAEQFALLGPA